MINNLTDDAIKNQVLNLGFNLIRIDMIKGHPKLVIKDKIGYFYYYYLSNLKRYSPSIAQPNNPYSVYNISLWLKINKSNFQICEDTKYTKAREPLKLYCKKCDSIVFVNWNKVSQGDCCGFCSGRLVSDKNRLSILYPKLSEEWDYEKNYPLTPENVSFGSDKSASWICSNCSYKWKTNTILERSRGNGCPLCSGKIVTDKNRFIILYPEIAKQWNIKKNKKLNSKDFSYGSNKEVWWICENCGYEWKTSIGNRCSKNSGCLVCSGKMKLTLKYCRDFARKKGYKLIAKKYINAHEKMIFVHEKCGEDLVLDWHHFQQGQECLECTLKLRESKLANKLKKYYKSNFNADLESKKVKNPLTQCFLRYDIYLPKEKIFIEIHGGQHYSFVPYWHKTIENFEYCVYKDKIKKDFAEANGIYLELDLRDRWTVEQAINKINEVINSL